MVSALSRVSLTCRMAPLRGLFVQQTVTLRRRGRESDLRDLPDFTVTTVSRTKKEKSTGNAVQSAGLCTHTVLSTAQRRMGNERKPLTPHTFDPAGGTSVRSRELTRIGKCRANIRLTRQRLNHIVRLPTTGSVHTQFTATHPLTPPIPSR